MGKAYSNIRSEMVDGNLVYYDAAGNVLFTIDGTNSRVTDPKAVYNKRVRSTAAEVNAGNTLLPAVPGFAYRIVDFTMIAIGGSAATATSVDIIGTRSAAEVRPFVVAV